ncbi:MAG: DUF721 domain-containing protein [Proteobacteria bacterium]|nr:DUF721 domain-containing protein [Pseudomonadota bacterium]
MKKNFRKKSTPQNISGILNSLLVSRKIKKRIDDCKAMDLWDSVVGEKIASRTEPFALRDGVLKVYVSDHGWLQELQFLKEEIKDKLNEALGKDSIENLYFKLGTVKEKEKEAVEPSLSEQLKKVTLTKKEKEEISALVDKVENKEIKEAIKKVLTKEAKRKKITSG